MNFSFRSKRFIFGSLGIALSYFIAVSFLMNLDLFKDTVWGNYPLQYKLSILLLLIESMWSIMSKLAFFLVATTALLTGVNIMLIIQRLNQLKASGTLQFMIGGGSLVGVVSSGCAACGLPILSLLGLGGSIAYLPLQGLELSLVAISMLSISIYVILSQKVVCGIPVK